MHHSWPGGSTRKSLKLPERKETIVSGCTRRRHSCSMCPQKAEHRLSELQRQVRATAISSDPRDGHEPLTLLSLPPRILCASADHYPQPPRETCRTSLPRSHVPGATSSGEHMACLRLLQCHAGLCCHRLTPNSNYDYCTPPSAWPE